jgi:hypothetical protein
LGARWQICQLEQPDRKDEPANVLQASLPPRGLSRVLSAAYIGVLPALFDELVRGGRMPQPIRTNSRVLWDRSQLDEAFTALAGELENV